MKKPALFLPFAVALLASPAFAAFNSGSSGADGAFNPSASIQLQLPPDGVFNYTDVNIPAGVTVTFIKNAANTPVVMLASGDITVAGTLSVSAPAASGQAAGAGGPGGYDGGKGGAYGSLGGTGKGPGGGNGGALRSGSSCAGGGGGYAGQGGTASGYACSTPGGAAYGSSSLSPLIGGSGGGGGSGASSYNGYGGGGGGGALLLAASGKITVTGAITADGFSQQGGYDSRGHESGAGSGGAIRLIASIIAGNGTISAKGGSTASYGGVGAPGRIRLETYDLQRTGSTSPLYSFAAPREVFAAAVPTLRFVSIAGVAAPAQPTGYLDVTLPAGTGNPVTVELAGSGIPLGSTVKLVAAATGATSTATSTPLSGSESASTASAQINIADGPSTLIATVGFTVTAALGRELAPYAAGETVARIELTAGLQGASNTKLITASGKEYLLPPAARAVLAQ